MITLSGDRHFLAVLIGQFIPHRLKRSGGLSAFPPLSATLPIYRSAAIMNALSGQSGHCRAWSAIGLIFSGIASAALPIVFD
jgi:hypothetical protein